MALAVGDLLQGTVTGITRFGLFVELPGGATGMVHISEVADEYVKDIHDYFKVGDSVEVMVIRIGEDGKIGLSIRQAKPHSEDNRESTMRRPPSSPRKERTTGEGRRPGGRSGYSFEDKLARFLKDSEDRLGDLKRNTDSKRGGRGARHG
ncbi:MAG: RNA-binding protein S1 [Firmicutes bacterium]|nr:RNA-binding protein S1 [Bacillota bacterium]